VLEFRELMHVPDEQAWLFWEVAPEQIDLDRDADYVLCRALERGRMVDVRWAIRYYGFDRIRSFFESDYHAELSPRTLALWRAYFGVLEGAWPSPPSFRRSSAAPFLT
jgi:hypothetical protein